MTEVSLKEVNLENIANGACGELFAHAMSAVLKNIDDVNTDPKAKREITLKVTFKPTESRELTAIEVKCDTKLPGVKPVQHSAYLVRDGLGMKAMTQNLVQPGLFGQEENVVPMVGGKEGRK
jgi:hypothetical protein